MLRTTWAAGLAVGAGLAFASPAAALPGCDAFLQKIRAEGSELGLDYSRALVVSRVPQEIRGAESSARVSLRTPHHATAKAEK